MANRYFVCARNRPPLELDIGNDSPPEGAEIGYFIRIFRILDQHYGLDGYTVCFAYDSRTRLPQLGADVIALVYGDEHCRVPAYANSVNAVVKCHGLVPAFVPRRRPLRLAQIEAAEFLRNFALWLPVGWRWVLSRRMRARCHLVPIGYGITTEIQPVPFEQRPIIASFQGSVAPPPPRSLRALIGTPKSYCRTALVQTLRHLQARYGKDAIKLGITSGFQESLQDAGQTYFQALARSKLCVAPRGTTFETWRICDGLKFGCVVIADRLPPHPFYRESPIIQIEDWRDLPALVEELLADEARMRDLHERSLRYWRDVLSEQAVAARCAAALGLPVSRA